MHVSNCGSIHVATDRSQLGIVKLNSNSGDGSLLLIEQIFHGQGILSNKEASNHVSTQVQRIAAGASHQAYTQKLESPSL